MPLAILSGSWRQLAGQLLHLYKCCIRLPASMGTAAPEQRGLRQSSGVAAKSLDLVTERSSGRAVLSLDCHRSPHARPPVCPGCAWSEHMHPPHQIWTRSSPNDRQCKLTSDLPAQAHRRTRHPRWLKSSKVDLDVLSHTHQMTCT